MSYLKRQKTPKKWPIKKKGTAYVVRTYNLNRGIPALVVLRDMMNIVQNRKELKKAMNDENILINEKPLIDERKSILLFDVITLKPSKKYYRLGLSTKGKFEIMEIKESEAKHKISKIVNKKIQLNFIDGRNILSEAKCEVNDSVLINLKEKKIEKFIPMKENAKASIFDGKHSGKMGVVKKIYKEKKIAELDIDGKPTNVLIKQFMVVE